MFYCKSNIFSIEQFLILFWFWEVSEKQTNISWTITDYWTRLQSKTSKHRTVIIGTEIDEIDSVHLSVEEGLTSEFFRPDPLYYLQRSKIVHVTSNKIEYQDSLGNSTIEENSAPVFRLLRSDPKGNEVKNIM